MQSLIGIIDTLNTKKYMRHVTDRFVRNVNYLSGGAFYTIVICRNLLTRAEHDTRRSNFCH